MGFLDSWVVTSLICLNKEAALGLDIPIGASPSLNTVMAPGGRASETVHCLSTIPMGCARITTPRRRNHRVRFKDAVQVVWFHWTCPRSQSNNSQGHFPIRGGLCRILGGQSRAQSLSLQRPLCLGGLSLAVLIVGIYAWSFHRSPPASCISRAKRWSFLWSPAR